MRKIIIILSVLLICLFAFSSCGATATFQDDSESVVLNDADSEDGIFFDDVLRIWEKDGIKISFTLADGWLWREAEENSTNAPGIEIYKKTNSSDGEDAEWGEYFEVRYYKDGFGVCGTGLTTEDIVLDDGNTAHVGYYEGVGAWSHVSFSYEIPSFAAVNFGLVGNDAEEALAIIRTMTFSN